GDLASCQVEIILMAGGKSKGANLGSEKRTTRIDKDVVKVSATNRALSYAYDLLWSYRYFHIIVAILLLAELVLGVLIIQKIPYTEIDWKAYMQQVTQFKNGERDYINIRGDTGPLVYPAGHVYIYAFLHWVTNNGEDIRRGIALSTFAVSIKMNVLLFAPALFFLLLQSSGVLRTIGYLSICASLQVALALPFIKTFWWSYLTKAFEFSRVFTYQWTVNWKCIPEHEALMSGMSSERVPIRVERIVTSLFVVNFVGICFSRTLHYQFYAWYFPTLPYLLWKTNMPMIFKAKVLIICEYAFNTFPATDVSSTVLHLSHFMLLVSLYTASDEGSNHDPMETSQTQCIPGRRSVRRVGMTPISFGLVMVTRLLCQIDEQEVVLRLPKMNFTLAIGFGSSAPVTTEGYARRVLSGMSKEAEYGLSRGLNMGQVMTRGYNEFKKNHHEGDDGELNVQLRRRK
ncbi:hypothetical protein DYB32_002823, partial [Aphanomyces invadans]